MSKSTITSNTVDDQALDTRGAAKVLGISASTLNKARMTGRNASTIKSEAASFTGCRKSRPGWTPSAAVPLQMQERCDADLRRRHSNCRQAPGEPL